MRVRNRIKKMVAVENRYFNRQGAISVLIGITLSLLGFNVVINIFYCFAVLRSESNLVFFRTSIYILLGYIIAYIAFRIIMRYLGINYALTMIFTSISYCASASSGYMLVRAIFSWDLSSLIDNPLGFEPLLFKIYSTVLKYLIYISLFYIFAALIPAWMQRPLLFGRFWILNIISPMLILPAVFYTTVFISEETRVEFACSVVLGYLTLMTFFAFRFFFKTVCYFLLLPAERRLKIEDIPKKRREKLKINVESATELQPGKTKPEDDTPGRVVKIENKTISIEETEKKKPRERAAIRRQIVEDTKKRGLETAVFEVVVTDESFESLLEEYERQDDAETKSDSETLISGSQHKNDTDRNEEYMPADSIDAETSETLREQELSEKQEPMLRYDFSLTREE